MTEGNRSSVSYRNRNRWNAEERKAFVSALTKMLGTCGEQLGIDTILSDSRAEQKEIYVVFVVIYLLFSGLRQGVIIGLCIGEEAKNMA